MTIDDALEQVQLAGWELLSLVNQTLAHPDYLVFLKRRISLNEYRSVSGRGPTPREAIISALNLAVTTRPAAPAPIPAFAPPEPSIPSFEDFMKEVGEKQKGPGASPGK